jgi:hypothetical protein
MAALALRSERPPGEAHVSAASRAAEVERLRAALPAPIQGRVRRARELVRRPGEGPPGEERLATSLAAFDRVLAGGLPRGALVELVGGRSSGRFALVLAALAAATRGGEAAALVDLGSHLDPRAAEEAGCDLERLLWVRPLYLRETLAGAEMLLTGGFPLVVVDLGSPPIPGGRGEDASWLRLARAAEAHRAALVVATPYRVAATAAAMVVRTQARRPAWRGTGREPRLLAGMDSRLVLEKCRAARLAHSALLDPSPAARFELECRPGRMSA